MRRAVCVLVATWLPLVAGLARAAVHGPLDVAVLQGGTGLAQPLPKQAPLLRANADWTTYAWVRPQAVPEARLLLAGVGNPLQDARYFMLDHGRLGFQWSPSSTTMSRTNLVPQRWQFVAAVSSHGHFTLYLDGKPVASGSTPQVAVAPQMAVAPSDHPVADAVHFGGKIADFVVRDGALDGHALRQLARRPPDPELIRFTPASPHWPVQTRQMAGQVTPQAPATLPVSRAPFAAPVRKPSIAQAALIPDGAQRWALGRWQLAAAPQLAHADGATLSEAGYQPGAAWMPATVPGTVLTTLVDRGIYPDPTYGLNNLAIPESLNKHDWWYRTRFKLPAAAAGRHLQLDFNGINYAAEVWVNGQRVGNITGAFMRGQFDVSKLLHAGGDNVIAVRVSPPPDPGVPHEQSLAAGPGPNGGMLALDGPTFIASEGWDWIPAIRDRETGLWQDVTLSAAGLVRIGDTHVVTQLPDGSTGSARISVDVPLANPGTVPVAGRVQLAFGDVTVSKDVTVPAGGITLHLRPADFPQLVLAHPHLWWPNGYGDPYLYDMHVQFEANGGVSDQQQFHFGIRQISYELSLFDDQGRLRRVLLTPDLTRVPGMRLMDVSHKAIRQTPHGWAYSLRPEAGHSPAVRSLDDTRLTPYLAIRVNGVRIAVKGGSWGMDDMLKRVSREHLEPYFKLQRDAHLDVVRNWVGQSSEPEFYDLADKYGLLVFNDFWQSTQDYNMEPQDDALFLRNAADMIRRYRNHPSIALWFGRNEGVPQPLLNQRLDALIAKLDGTRLYMPSSNRINLWESGPYNYRPDQDYFTTLAKGFAVEVGTPSFPTLEAFEAMMPKADRWPISDDWAYHDWHQSGNGDVASFMAAMRTEYGKPTSLADFERKAQMLDYDSYRAIFEGLNAHLWTQNSGRLLWMSHPAWPSTTWQIYSHDYDTQSSYYGVMHAAEPVHVQMNLPDRQIMVVDNTTKAIRDAQLDISVYALDGTLLAHALRPVQAAAVAATPIHGGPALDELVHAHGVIFVALALKAQDGQLLSRNFYWTSVKPGDLRKLDQLPVQVLQLSVRHDGAGRLAVHLANPGRQVALNAKLTLVDAHGKRILPAYYSDNYVNLPPGAARDIGISVDSGTSLTGARVQLRGWNVVPNTAPAFGKAK
ncbi:LamG-like jellyroll fold domain-containing protein [Rhodanobacter sp. 115]